MTATTLRAPRPPAVETPDEVVKTPPRPAWPIIAVAVVTGLLTALTVLRFLNGHASVDLAHFDQGLWRASRGNGSLSTIFGYSLLEDHFGPAILGFVPLYQLIASPIWLLLAQGAAVGAATWQVVRRLAPRTGWNWAVVLGTLLLLSPPVTFALFWDVHPVVMAAPFALAGVFAVNEGRPTRAAVFGLCAALLRPDAAFAVLGAFAVAKGGRRRQLTPALVLVAYTVFAMVMEQQWGDSGSHWEAYYGHLGATPSEAFRQPLAWVSTLLSPLSMFKVFPWLVITGFLCLKRPRLMVPAVLAAMPTILSSWPGTHFWGFHYGVLPAFLLAPAWVAVVEENVRAAWRIVVGVLVLSFFAGPFTPAPIIRTSAQTAIEHLHPDAAALCIVRGIPAVAGVSTVTLGGLTHRDVVLLWPRPFRTIDPEGQASPYLLEPDAVMAAKVDYVIRGSADETQAPTGFVSEARAGRYERLRRSATTQASVPSCAVAAEGPP